MCLEIKLFLEVPLNPRFLSKSAVGARGTARQRCGKRGYHIVYKPVFLDHWQPKR